MDIKQPFEKHKELTESILGLTLFAIQPTVWNYHLQQINKLCLDLEKSIGEFDNFIDWLDSMDTTKKFPYLSTLKPVIAQRCGVPITRPA